jgi:hypothetical protein
LVRIGSALVGTSGGTSKLVADEEEERAVQELTARIVRASIERCKVFNMRMPQLEQLEGEEEDDEKDRRPLLKRKDD